MDFCLTFASSVLRTPGQRRHSGQPQEVSFFPENNVCSIFKNITTPYGNGRAVLTHLLKQSWHRCPQQRFLTPLPLTLGVPKACHSEGWAQYQVTIAASPPSSLPALLVTVTRHFGFVVPPPTARPCSCSAQVAYALSRSSLLQRMRDWVGPGGPARVAIGVDIKHRGPKGEMPRIEVMLQLRGQSSPSATVQCGADSGCCSPGMYDSTLFVPVNELLFGSPWFLRLLISMQLAVVVPLVGVVLGGLFAARDVLRGRRSLASVASSCLRSLRGPWWGVVPLDTYRIRSRVLMAMKNMD